MRVYKLNSDSARNPMRDYPRNLPCPCASGLKWKRCCLLKQPLIVKVRKETSDLALVVNKIKSDYKKRRKDK